MNENENKAPSQYEAGKVAGLNLALTRLIEAGVDVTKQMAAAILGCNAEAESEAVKKAKAAEDQWFNYYCARGKEIEQKEAEIADLKAQLEGKEKA